MPVPDWLGRTWGGGYGDGGKWKQLRCHLQAVPTNNETSYVEPLAVSHNYIWPLVLS